MLGGGAHRLGIEAWPSGACDGGAGQEGDTWPHWFRYVGCHLLYRQAEGARPEVRVQAPVVFEFAQHQLQPPAPLLTPIPLRMHSSCLLESERRRLPSPTCREGPILACTRKEGSQLSNS